MAHKQAGLEMIALSEKAARLLAALRRHVESEDGEWGMVYLDNAHHGSLGMTPHQFAWHLSALSKAGLYKPVDGYAWGTVRLAD
jgi:hypothetical protein